MSENTGTFFGHMTTLSAVMIQVIPDDIMPIVVKIILAFVYGFASMAGQSLWKKLQKRNHVK
jgi:hypothetical protein